MLRLADPQETRSASIRGRTMAPGFVVFPTHPRQLSRLLSLQTGVSLSPITDTCRPMAR